MSRAAQVRTFIRPPDHPGIRRVLSDAVHSDDAYLHPGAQVWLSSSIFKGPELESNTTLAHPRLLGLDRDGRRTQRKINRVLYTDVAIGLARNVKIALDAKLYRLGPIEFPTGLADRSIQMFA